MLPCTPNHTHHVQVTLRWETTTKSTSSLTRIMSFGGKLSITKVRPGLVCGKSTSSKFALWVSKDVGQIQPIRYLRLVNRGSARTKQCVSVSCGIQARLSCTATSISSRPCPACCRCGWTLGVFFRYKSCIRTFSLPVYACLRMRLFTMSVRR